MVDSGYSMDIYKSVKTSIGTLMRNPEIFKLVPDHLNKTKTNSMQLKDYLS